MTFNPEAALESMVINTKLNDLESRLTLYCIVCPEHGGLVTRSLPEALDAAIGANERSDGCEYAAVAIGLDAEMVKHIFAPPPEGS